MIPGLCCGGPLPAVYAAFPTPPPAANPRSGSRLGIRRSASRSNGLQRRDSRVARRLRVSERVANRGGAAAAMPGTPVPTAPQPQKREADAGAPPFTPCGMWAATAQRPRTCEEDASELGLHHRRPQSRSAGNVELQPQVQAPAARAGEPVSRKSGCGRC